MVVPENNHKHLLMLCWGYTTSSNNENFSDLLAQSGSFRAAAPQRRDGELRQFRFTRKFEGARRISALHERPADARPSHDAQPEIVVTDTIPLREDAKVCKKIRVLTVSGLLAETMRRISNEDSVSSLFVE